MRRYLVLLVAAVGVAALMGLVARRPRPARTVEASAPVRRVTLELTVRENGLTPGVGSVPKEHRVDLHVRNATGRALRLVLAGYEDRVALALAPGESLRTEFLADRPGDDFAWLVDGRPAGRLHVLGSHLVEGHR